MGRVGGSVTPGHRGLTLLGALGAHGGHAGVQHIIDGRVAVEAPLHVVLTVRLVTLLMATVLQTVPLQVLERGAAEETQLSLTGWDKAAPDTPQQCRDGSPLPSPAPSDTPRHGELGQGEWGALSDWHLRTPNTACTTPQAAPAHGCGVSPWAQSCHGSSE